MKFASLTRFVAAAALLVALVGCAETADTVETTTPVVDETTTPVETDPAVIETETETADPVVTE